MWRFAVWRRTVAALVLSCVAVAADEGVSPVVALGELKEMSLHGRTPPRDATVVGRVLGAEAESGLIALEDASASAVLKVALPEEAWRGMQEGSVVELGFRHCCFERRGFVIDCGVGPVVETDGRHPPLGRAGTVHLPAGLQPLVVEWFNGQADAFLELGVSGGGVAFAEIPAGMLFHRSEGPGGAAPGLKYEMFRTPAIDSVEEIPVDGAVVSGVVPRFEIPVAEGITDTAVRFTGLLDVPEDGEYTFTLASDDGGRLFIGESTPSWRVLPEVRTEARPGNGRGSWITRSGTLVHAGEDRSWLRLELVSGQERLEVMAPRGSQLDVASVAGETVEVSGLGYPGGIGVLGPSGVRAADVASGIMPRLVRAGAVRELQPAQAAEALPVELEGVVTMANFRSMVIQDETGGIFVLLESVETQPSPAPGERWRVEGTTLRGDFSPVVVARSARLLGQEALPVPRRPAWEELLNGSADAEQVELEGVVLQAGPAQVELLTRDGTVVVESRELYPLPAALRDPERQAELVGARVRLRGVFATSWDRTVGRLRPGVLALGNATLAVDEPPPADLDAVPQVGIPELWGFTPESTALKRMRLRGRLMARRGDLLLMSDGANSLRLENVGPTDAKPGDEVEAVGFPRTGAVSPILLHPVVRVVKRDALPTAEEVSPGALPDRNLDGRVVAIEARVLTDTLRQDERSLELAAGDARFFAVAPADPEGRPLARDTVVRVDGVYVADAPLPGAAGTGGFELRLADGDAIQVLAQPPWWTPARLVVLVSALVGGLALLLAWAAILHRQVARRTSQLAIEIHEKEHAESERTLEMERARVARDLHDELGAGLTEIGMLGALVANPEVPGVTKAGYVDTMRTISNALVGGLDEIVWAINPSYDSVDDATGYLWLYAQRMLKPSGIECRFGKRAEISYRHFGSRRRHSLLLAFKEALNNVVRHSGASVVTLDASIRDGEVQVTVADDGVGMDPGVSAPGSDGLAGMRARMREFGGDCRIESKVGGGTTVTLILPLKQP